VPSPPRRTVAVPARARELVSRARVALLHRGVTRRLRRASAQVRQKFHRSLQLRVVSLTLVLSGLLVGVFGWMVVFLPDVFYFGYGLLWLLALWGIGHGVLVSRTWPPERKLLILAPLLILPLVVYANLTFIAWQGRYFFPALPAVSLLLAFGLNELPRQTRRWGVLLAPGFTLAANLYALFLVASSMVRA